jgi:AcrR family transcriptional regulator
MSYRGRMAVRSETSRKAVLQATMDLLGDQPPGPLSLQKLSIEGIARQAGVSKMTIYRWWPNKAALVIDSFLDNHVASTPVEDEGPALDALRRHVASLARIYAGPEGRLIAQLIAECQFDPATLREFKERFWEGRVVAVRRLIERAIHEGELRADVEPDEIAELLYAPIYFRLLFQNGSLEAEAAERLVDVALEGLRARRARPVSATSAAGAQQDQTRETA